MVKGVAAKDGRFENLGILCYFVGPETPTKLPLMMIGSERGKQVTSDPSVVSCLVHLH